MWQVAESASVKSNYYSVIRQSHKHRFRLEFLNTSHSILWSRSYPDSEILGDTKVDVDATSDGSTRTLSLHVINKSGLFDCDPSSPEMTPMWLDNYIRLLYGVYSPTKKSELPATDGYVWVPLITSTIKSVDIDEESKEITITGSDKAANFKDPNKFTAPYTVPKGTRISTAITNLAKTYGETKFRVQTNKTPTVKDLLFAADSEPWAALKAIAALAPTWALFYDGQGYLVFRPKTTTAVYNVNAGASGVITKTPKKAVDFDDFKNVVVVTGANASLVYTMRAVSTHPLSTSKTRQVRPLFYENKAYTTLTQCKAKATELLNKSLLVENNITLDSVLIPFLQENDYIYITSPKAKLTKLKLLLETFSFDFSDGLMSIGSKHRQVVRA